MKFDLVFAGGGAKGIVHSGAVQELLDQGHDFRRLVGTSAGAITAVLLAAGFTAQEVVDVFTEKLPDGSSRLGTLKDAPENISDDMIFDSMLYSLIRDVEPSFIPKREQDKFMQKLMREFMKSTSFRELFSFIEYGGAYGGNAFLLWMQEELSKKSLGKATFAEFHEATGNHVTAVATDIDDSNRLILNHITTPNLPVAWAARMSMSIPLVWQEVVWKKEWGLYKGIDIAGHTIVDGGVVSNLPLDLVMIDLPKVILAMGEKPDDNNAIGLYIDTSLPVPTPSTEAETQKKSRNPFSEDSHLAQINHRMNSLIDTFTRAHDRIVANTYPNNICHLPAQGYDTMDFNMSDDRVQALVNAGTIAMRDFLTNWDN